MADPVKEAASWLWTTSETFFTAMFKSVWEGSTEFLSKALVLTWNFWADHADEIIGESWAGMLDMYKDAGYLNQEARDTMLSMNKMNPVVRPLMFVGQMLLLATNYLTAANAPAQAIMVQQELKNQRPALPNYQDVIQAAFTAPEKTGEVRDILARLGFPDDIIDLLFLSNYRLYDVTVIRDLFLRGVLNNEEMFVRMRELGFTDTRIQEMIQLWEIIPTAQDLFWMVGKEAFEPDVIKMIGLDEEFPAEQTAWLKKQGISEDWAKKYWYAHWDQPSVSMGYEMLHRGVIGWEELNVLFKAVEMPPFWRDKLTEIAFTLPGRIDVRRMHDMGVYDRPRVLKAYTSLGYAPEDAEAMTEFTVRYNQQNNKELTKSQLIRSYIDGLISRQDCYDMLITIDYPEAMAEYVIVLAEFQRDLDYQNAIVKNIGDRYKNNLISISEVRQRFGELNLPTTKQTILIDAWDLDKFEDMKLPSKTDLEKFYLNNLITKDIYQMELQKLGYGSVYASRYIELSDKKR